MRRLFLAIGVAAATLIGLSVQATAVQLVGNDSVTGQICYLGTPTTKSTCVIQTSVGGKGAAGNFTPLQFDGAGNLLVNLNAPNPVPVSLTPPSATLTAGTAHVVMSGGAAVIAFGGPVHGCYITNPPSAADEGISTVETLYVDPVNTAATSSANGTSVPIQPGQTFYCVPGQTNAVSVNAVTGGHQFVVSQW